MRYLITELHKQRFFELLKLDETSEKDVERRSLFYILSGNDELYGLTNEMYDFNDHSIEPDILDTSICSSSKALIKLAFNLYNGDFNPEIMATFCGLDSDNFELAIRAIRMRFNY